MMGHNAAGLEFSIRFLNIKSLVGIVVCVMGSIFYYFEVSSITRSSFIAFDRDLQYTKGHIVSIAETSFREGGETSRIPIFEIGFRYEVGDEIHFNVGYTESEDVRVGDEVDISYKKADPDISKAATLRASPHGVYGLIMIVLPLAGLLLFAEGLRWGNKFIWLIKNGALVPGERLSVLENFDDYTVYYRYKDANGQNRRVAVESHKKAADQVVPILYDPNDPEKAEVLNWSRIPILFGRKTIKKMLDPR